jgi:hypothetical protein
VLGIGAGVLTIGAAFAGFAVLCRASESMRNVGSVLGVILTVTGALFAVVGMQRALAEDAYIAVRTDGVLVHVGAISEHVAWDTIERIRFDAARGALVFVRRDGGEIVAAGKFADTDQAELAARLDTLRRKAAHNILKA